MSDQSLMSIGRFAHLSGVTVHMLRHYDEVGILSPAVVDDTSLYRRYRPDQIRLARLIRVLRAADVPIEMIKQILEADAAGAEPMVRQLLQNHRDLLTLNRDHLTNRVNDVTPQPGERTAHGSHSPWMSSRADQDRRRRPRLLLSDDHERLDQPGRAAFSFLVDDLDVTYRQALAAGASAVTAPREAEGMPRGAGVRDPSGNMLGMAQS